MRIDEQVTFRKLEVFLCFIEHGSMSRVAEILGQSTVSVHRALHSLEDGLRCPLFRREGRKLVPLESARIFAGHAAQAVQACTEGIRRAGEAAGVGGPRLKVGSLYSLTLRTIPRLLMGLKKRRPSLDVVLTLSSNAELLAKLRQGELDAIIIARDEGFASADVLQVPMFSDDIFFAAPLASPYAALDAIDLNRVCHESFVCLNDDFATQQSFLHAFAQARLTPRIGMQVGDIFSLINLVSGGLGYALLPGRVGDFGARIQLIPIVRPVAQGQQISLFFPRNRERDPNLLALSAECRLFRRSASFTSEQR